MNWTSHDTVIYSTLRYLGTFVHAVFLLKFSSLPSQSDDILNIRLFIRSLTHSLTHQYVMSTQIMPRAGDTTINENSRLGDDRCRGVGWGEEGGLQLIVNFTGNYCQTIKINVQCVLSM